MSPKKYRIFQNDFLIFLLSNKYRENSNLFSTNNNIITLLPLATAAALILIINFSEMLKNNFIFLGFFFPPHTKQFVKENIEISRIV